MNAFTRWDDLLIAEHELIERTMAVLRANLEKLPGGDLLQIGRAFDFLQEFGDKVHNRKEEEFLFPLMHERGIPTQGGPIGVMLMEHEAERQLLRQMSASLSGIAQAEAEVINKFRQEGLAYLTIRAEHIWKENDILYPMARKIMLPGDAEKILAACLKINRETYGAEAWMHFSAMVTEVESGMSGAKGRLINRLSLRQLHAIMETLPFEVTFVDAEDTVAYFNRLDKEKIFPRTRSVIGRKVEKCHPEKSVHMVEKIVSGFKDRTMDTAEFWIDFRGDKVLIRYFPVYGEDGEYLGVLEVTQEIGRLQKLTGQKRLLD
ncbi:MAG: DUF438 domain-containing protein [Desulfobulbaceae bacterium]|nr:DUF438 domain-containing protein [Desulfobulbaceae bacterium]